MRLIDADKLYPDSVSIKGDRLCISQSQIANAPTVDVLEQIREGIKNQLFIGRMLNSKDFDDGLKWCLELINKYR